MHYSQKFQKLYDWQDDRIPSIIALLESLSKRPVKIEIASEELDNNFSTDLIATDLITHKIYHIAVRLRDNCKHRDLTLRSKLDSGTKTELEKVKAGCTNFYFYGWLANDDLIDWMFVDMHKVRKSGILDKNWPDIDNHDGSFFVAIPKNQLKESIINTGGI